MATAGYAATLSLHERLFQLFVRSYYNAGLAAPKLSISAPEAGASIFLALPEVRIHRDPISGITFEFRGWGALYFGRIVIPPWGEGVRFPLPPSRKVKFNAIVRCLVTATAEAGGLTLQADPDSMEFGSYSFDPYSGSLFSAEETAYLQSVEWQTAMLDAFRDVFVAINQALPPFGLESLGLLAYEPSLTPTIAYAEEALLVGFDVDTPTLSTSGQPGNLADYSGGNDVGLWIGRDAVDPAYATTRDEIETKVADQGATLGSFRIMPEDGWLVMSGTASKYGHTISFSCKAIPRLIRPGWTQEWDEEYGGHFVIGEPDREELWFETTDIVVDVERPWWEPLAEFAFGVLTLGVGFFVVEGLVGFVRGNVGSLIDSNEGSQGQRNRQFTLLGVTRPAIQLRLEEFESHAQGIYSGVRIRANSWWGAELTGPQALAADETLLAAPRFTVSLPADVLEADPELRVAWNVRRRDTNEVVLSRDTLAEDNLSISFDNAVVPFLDVESVGVEVRVYRTLGVEIDEIFHENRIMNVVDYVDRSHPFVRWSHQAVVPIVRVEADGSKTIVTEAAVGRNSALHRTAIPGRCRMLRNHSLQRVLPKNGPPFALEYLDALPFPAEEIVEKRAGLCDYCFFGGPTRDIPLI